MVGLVRFVTCFFFSAAALICISLLGFWLKIPLVFNKKQRTKNQAKKKIATASGMHVCCVYTIHTHKFICPTSNRLNHSSCNEVSPTTIPIQMFFLKNPTKNATEIGRKRKTTKNLTSTIKCIFIFILGYFCIEDVWKHVFTLQTDEDCIAHNIHKRQFLCIFFLPFVHTDKHTPTHMVLLNLFQITLDRFVHMHRMYKILWNNLHAYSVFIWKYDRVLMCMCVCV